MLFVIKPNFPHHKITLKKERVNILNTMFIHPYSSQQKQHRKLNHHIYIISKWSVWKWMPITVQGIVTRAVLIYTSLSLNYINDTSSIWIKQRLAWDERGSKLAIRKSNYLTVLKTVKLSDCPVAFLILLLSRTTINYGFLLKDLVQSFFLSVVNAN